MLTLGKGKIRNSHDVFMEDWLNWISFCTSWTWIGGKIITWIYGEDSILGRTYMIDRFNCFRHRLHRLCFQRGNWRDTSFTLSRLIDWLYNYLTRELNMFQIILRIASWTNSLNRFGARCCWRRVYWILFYFGNLELLGTRSVILIHLVIWVTYIKLRVLVVFPNERWGCLRIREKKHIRIDRFVDWTWWNCRRVDICLVLLRILRGQLRIWRY